MKENVYEQLIDDYHESSKSWKHGFLFDRIMNFIFDRLPDNEKNLYLEIRKDTTLKELDTLLGKDWVDSTYLRSDMLIKQARKRREKVMFS